MMFERIEDDGSMKSVRVILLTDKKIVLCMRVCSHERLFSK